jgi:hypothetical protein
MVAIGWFPFICVVAVWRLPTDWHDHFQRAAGVADSCRPHASLTEAILVLTGTAWPKNVSGPVMGLWDDWGSYGVDYGTHHGGHWRISADANVMVVQRTKGR